MRLIDADLLIKNLEEEIEKLKCCPDCLPKVVTKECMELYIKEIKYTPTAYDVDNVVEGLKDAIYYDESGVHTVIGSGRAIEIVKVGGKNEQ